MKKKISEANKQHLEDTMLLVQAIVAAIQIVAEDREKHGGKPIMLNSIVNAMVSGLAHYVAGIPDDKERETFFARIGFELMEQIMLNVETGSRAEVFSKQELH